MPAVMGPGASSRFRTSGLSSERTFHTLTTPSEEPV
jgi:hypothetical protein